MQNHRTVLMVARPARPGMVLAFFGALARMTCTHSNFWGGGDKWRVAKHHATSCCIIWSWLLLQYVKQVQESGFYVNICICIYMGTCRLSCSQNRPPQGGRLEARDRQGAPTPGSPWRAPCVPGWSAHGHMRAPTRGYRGQVAELRGTCFFCVTH